MATVEQPFTAPTLERSFLELYDLEAHKVLAYLIAATGQRADAEDLAAETFLRAWRAWPRFEHSGVPARFWLLKIARNLVLDRARSRARLVAFQQVPERGEESAEDSAIRRTVLLAALQRASEQDRELLSLRAAGLSFAEVGEAVGKSEAAAKMAWHRAARKLRDHLEVSGG